MRLVFRAFAAVVAASVIFNLAWAQKSLNEVPEAERERLHTPGEREGHQGPDNPRQGNTSTAQGRFGGPDVYGPEDFRLFREKNERDLNNPQWQLKIDLQDPKRIVVDYADGTSEEYWYVMFRVVNANTRAVKRTTLPTPNSEDVNLGSPPEPLEVRGGLTEDREGVPVNCHLDFELHVFTRDIEKDPWDSAIPEEPEEAVMSEEAKAQRHAQMKKTYRAISDPFVLQRITEQEEMFEWAGNHAGISEAISLLHPLADFQRQVGFAHDLANGAPDLSGPRCLPYRHVVVRDGEVAESTRYVAVHADNTFAGFHGEGDTLPEGARLVKDPSDAMWGKLTQRRYEEGDCIDRFGKPLQPNDPGYLNARAATGKPDEEHSYGILQAGHPAVGQPVLVPHYRQYKAGDKVLWNFDTGMVIPGRPNDTYKLNGKIVIATDPRYGSAEEVSGAKFGGEVAGKPVKMVDSRGRAIRKYLVTYQEGDTVTQAEWNIWKARLGPGILSRYASAGDIVGRPLRADDPLVGLPKIKMGFFVGADENKAPESIQRGVDTGRRGPKGEVILDKQEFATGRDYDPRKVTPDDFMRDPEGEFSTNRTAPVPEGSSLNPGEEYVYAPLGVAAEGAVPVPYFDHHGAWADYLDDLSGVRIPLTDERGELVRDHLDQILYLKEYEYEYVYLYEYAPAEQTESGFKGEYGGDRWKLVNDSVRMMQKDGKAVAPLMRLLLQKRKVTEPAIVDGYEHVGADGKISYLSEEDYKAANGGNAPGPNVVKVKIVGSTESEEDVVVGVYTDGMTVPAGAKAESWSEAEDRARRDGFTVVQTDVIRYVNRFRDKHVAGATPGQGEAPNAEDFEESERKDNGLGEHFKTWRRWTVPPPLVYRNEQGEWEVLTRFADKVGPANRWDGADTPRFLTRYVSEMWGVAIFKGVKRDWDYANVYVRGLRGIVANKGLMLDTNVPNMPSPSDLGASTVDKAFYNARYVAEDWTYRVRYERLGDEFENFRDVVRRQRTFWYRESDAEIAAPAGGGG